MERADFHNAFANLQVAHEKRSTFIGYFGVFYDLSFPFKFMTNNKLGKPNPPNHARWRKFMFFTILAYRLYRKPS